MQPTTTVDPVPALYEADETAWLEQTAGLIADGRFADLDYDHLREYLEDMARRDRREVLSRLVVLLAHVLKWEHQPGGRSTSWRLTIAEQRRELGQLFLSRVLRNHADEALAAAYRSAVEEAAIETGLPPTALPGECPYTVAEILAFNPLAG